MAQHTPQLTQLLSGHWTQQRIGEEKASKERYGYSLYKNVDLINAVSNTSLPNEGKVMVLF